LEITDYKIQITEFAGKFRTESRFIRAPRGAAAESEEIFAGRPGAAAKHRQRAAAVSRT
jgi:hypothetical protein